MTDPANGKFWNDQPSNEEQLRLLEEMRKMEEAKARQEEKRAEREKMKQGYGPADATGPRMLMGRELGSVAMRAIDWLWIGWIPKGYVTLIAGETGAGKSTILADIASRVTTGRPWPGEYDCPNAWRPPERVLWLGSEDSIEEMTVPRLVACGANRHNVVEIQGVEQQGKRNTFSMQDDLEAVSQWLSYARKEGRPFAMLVIDPVTSYLPGQKLRKVDMNDAGQLRTVLEPWLKLAEEHAIAIVCVTHFAKDTNRNMLHRVLGSAAFAQTCRSLCAVMDRPATEDYEPEPHEKLLMQVKVNLPEHPGGAWRFFTERVTVGNDHRNGKPILATRPNWQELDSALSPNTMVGRSRGPKSQQTPQFALWLKALFMTYPDHEWVPVSNVRAAAVPSVVSESWWNKHSADHMEKKNEGGQWLCKPKVAVM
jgi:AAA domain